MKKSPLAKSEGAFFHNDLPGIERAALPEG